jgi:hypothetical protein
MASSSIFAYFGRKPIGEPASVQALVVLPSDRTPRRQPEPDEKLLIFQEFGRSFAAGEKFLLAPCAFRPGERAPILRSIK